MASVAEKEATINVDLIQVLLVLGYYGAISAAVISLLWFRWRPAPLAWWIGLYEATALLDLFTTWAGAAVLRTSVDSIEANPLTKLPGGWIVAIVGKLVLLPLVALGLARLFAKSEERLGLLLPVGATGCTLVAVVWNTAVMLFVGGARP